MQENNSTASDIGGTLLSVAILAITFYFAWSARPAIDYFSSLSGGLESYGGVSGLLGYLWSLMGAMMVIVSLMVIVMELFVSDDESDGSTAFLLLIVWAALGWFVGHNFNPSDSPKLAYLAFTATTYLLAINLAIKLFSGLTKKAKL